MDARSLIKLALNGIDDNGGISSYSCNDIKIQIEVDDIYSKDSIIHRVGVRTITPLESNGNEVIQYILDNDTTKDDEKEIVAYKLGCYCYYLDNVSTDQFMKIWEALFPKNKEELQ